MTSLKSNLFRLNRQDDRQREWCVELSWRYFYQLNRQRKIIRLFHIWAICCCRLNSDNRDFPIRNSNHELKAYIRFRECGSWCVQKPLSGISYEKKKREFDWNVAKPQAIPIYSNKNSEMLIALWSCYGIIHGLPANHPRNIAPQKKKERKRKNWFPLENYKLRAGWWKFRMCRLCIFTSDRRTWSDSTHSHTYWNWMVEYETTKNAPKIQLSNFGISPKWSRGWMQKPKVLISLPKWLDVDKPVAQPDYTHTHPHLQHLIPAELVRSSHQIFRPYSTGICDMTSWLF